MSNYADLLERYQSDPIISDVELNKESTDQLRMKQLESLFDDDEFKSPIEDIQTKDYSSSSSNCDSPDDDNSSNDILNLQQQQHQQQEILIDQEVKDQELSTIPEKCIVKKQKRRVIFDYEIILIIRHSPNVTSKTCTKHQRS